MCVKPRAREVRACEIACVWKCTLIKLCACEKVCACESACVEKCVRVNRYAPGTVTINEGRIPFVMKRLWLYTLKIMMLF